MCKTTEWIGGWMHVYHFLVVDDGYQILKKKTQQVIALTNAVKTPRTVIPTIGATWIVTPGSMINFPLRSMVISMSSEYGLSICRNHFSPITRPPDNSVSVFLACTSPPLSISFNTLLLSQITIAGSNNNTAIVAITNTLRAKCIWFIEFFTVCCRLSQCSCITFSLNCLAVRGPKFGLCFIIYYKYFFKNTPLRYSTYVYSGWDHIIGHLVRFIYLCFFLSFLCTNTFFSVDSLPFFSVT